MGVHKNSWRKRCVNFHVFPLYFRSKDKSIRFTVEKEKHQRIHFKIFFGQPTTRFPPNFSPCVADKERHFLEDNEKLLTVAISVMIRNQSATPISYLIYGTFPAVPRKHLPKCKCLIVRYFSCSKFRIFFNLRLTHPHL